MQGGIWYPGSGRQIHVDNLVSCARIDKQQPCNLSFITSLDVEGKTIILVVLDGCGSHNKRATSLTHERVYTFQDLCSEAFESHRDLSHAIEYLMSRVTTAIEGRVQDLREDEKEMEEIRAQWTYDDSDDIQDEPLESMDTLKAQDWTPSFHSTVVAISGSDIAVGGPGAFATALVDCSTGDATWLAPGSMTARIKPNDVLVLGPRDLPLDKVTPTIARRGESVDIAELLSSLTAENESTVLCVKVLV
ncbi:hypothetical protein SELMODRAFT_424850 [Selaginella moellendorffii]|uniref:PPM-type phosphatase domain-containing protein n=1 Tax=Selaginella moellendorffii TaxID=88036 RepID=D8SR78_SELML|nr:hypothetical protein SELMODRAFT_424850 [Selaginella moellendorffii]